MKGELFVEHIVVQLGLHPEHAAWARTQNTAQQLWQECPQADWMAFMAARAGVPARLLVGHAAEFLRQLADDYNVDVLHLPELYNAIEALAEWSEGLVRKKTITGWISEALERRIQEIACEVGDTHRKDFLGAADALTSYVGYRKKTRRTMRPASRLMYAFYLLEQLARPVLARARSKSIEIELEGPLTMQLRVGLPWAHLEEYLQDVDGLRPWWNDVGTQK